jgi:hypothetical protein
LIFGQGGSRGRDAWAAALGSPRAQASLKGGGAESAPAGLFCACVAAVSGTGRCRSGSTGGHGARLGGVAFGPVAFERIPGRRDVAGGDAGCMAAFGDRPCAVMPLEPEPVSGGDLGGGRSS